LKAKVNQGVEPGLILVRLSVERRPVA